jgi:RNAse (barnase) inhibitor barstar
MYKISSVPNIKKRVQFLSAIYYQVNLLMKDLDKYQDSIVANAIRVSDIDQRDARYMMTIVDKTAFSNIDTFVAFLRDNLDLKDFKTANVIALWMNCFGTGTVFGLEYFPAFSTMMTNTYVGGYLDQQLTIEKIAGPLLVDFVKSIFQIGASVS